MKAINWNFDPAKARKIAAYGSAGLGVLLLVLAVATALYACYSLGILFNVGWFMAALVASVSVCSLGFHGIAVMSSPNNAGRLINSIFFGVWAMALLVITAAYFWLVATSSVKDGVIDFVKLERVGGRSDIADAGQSIYAFCAALPLLTTLIGIIVPRVSASPLNDLLHKTMGHAWSGWALNIASIAAALYGGFHILSFGQVVGMEGFAPIFAAVVLDVAFLGAKARLTSIFKIRKVKNPLTDVEFWALSVLCFLIAVYALLCNLGVTWLEPLDEKARLALIQSNQLVSLTVSAYGVLSPVTLSLLLVYSVAVLVAQHRGGLEHAAPPHPAETTKRFAKDEGDTKNNLPPHPDTTTSTRKCEECGKTFTGSSRAKYCGATCKQRAKRRRANAS